MTQWTCTELNSKFLKSANNGPVSLCEDLLRQGANVHVTDDRGRTALHYAARWGRLRTCQLLIENGADVNAVSIQSGSTPLLFAAEYGHVEACRILVAHGADVHGRRAARGYSTHTPLQAAVAKGKIDVVRYFVEECGEDLDQRTDSGTSLEQLATAFSEKEMASFIPVYRNSIKTERSVIDALQVDGIVGPPSSTRGFSPL